MNRAQTTERVKTILTQECQTTLGLVPPGKTSKVQPSLSNGRGSWVVGVGVGVGND